ncbi:hypothetical protein HPT28_12645 [Streptomyces sp. JJ38]|nr:hypothetical protein [Streptomyces sp. JJ38]
MWPDVLEAVKSKRRFTWILLSQNAQVSGFDGTTLQLGFPNAGARDNFSSGGSEDVLRSVLSERFGVQWKIEAVVDAGGGEGSASAAPSRPSYAQQPPPSAGFQPSQPSQPSQPPQQPWQSSTQAPQVPQAPQAPQNPQAPQGPQPPQSSHQQGGPSPARTAPSVPPVAESPPPPAVSVEDDIPEDDDPDLDESALSGHDLIIRELGATVVEEINHE